MFVGWLLRSFIYLFSGDARWDFSKSASQIFIKFGTDVHLCGAKCHH